LESEEESTSEDSDEDPEIVQKMAMLSNKLQYLAKKNKRFLSKGSSHKSSRKEEKGCFNCKNVYDVLFVKNNCTVISKDDQSIVFKGKRRNNVYKINFSELTDQKVLCLLSMSDKKWLWHRRFEAEGHYNDERWAWMQTEVQRINTEQQRQGVEITGLQNDVLRGNRINEENNQMLRNMMQHLHLQGPPYGPQ